MTVARKNFVVIEGDGNAVATAGDCTAVSSLIERAAGLANVIMQVPDDFDANVKVYELGCVKLCHHNFRSPMRADGRGAIERDSLSAGYSNVMLQLSGVLAINLIDRCSLILRPLEWCILPHVARFCNESSTPVEFVSMLIPNEELLPLHHVLRKFSERPISAKSGSAHLFFQFLADLVKQVPSLSTSSRISFSDALIQLLKTTIADMAAVSQSVTAHEHLYLRTCEIIERNLGNEDLSLTYVARRMNCSKRFLHLLFSNHNKQYTLSSYINHRRLSRCRYELAFQSFSGESISEIAHRWGFHDPSYFAKMFRRAFGVSPRMFADAAAAPSVLSGQPTIRE